MAAQVERERSSRSPQLEVRPAPPQERGSSCSALCELVVTSVSWTSINFTPTGYNKQKPRHKLPRLLYLPECILLPKKPILTRGPTGEGALVPGQCLAPQREASASTEAHQTQN